MAYALCLMNIIIEDHAVIYNILFTRIIDLTITYGTGTL